MLESVSPSPHVKTSWYGCNRIELLVIYISSACKHKVGLIFMVNLHAICPNQNSLLSRKLKSYYPCLGAWRGMLWSLFRTVSSVWLKFWLIFPWRGMKANYLSKDIGVRPCVCWMPQATCSLDYYYYYFWPANQIFDVSCQNPHSAYARKVECCFWKKNPTGVPSIKAGWFYFFSTNTLAFV